MPLVAIGEHRDMPVPLRARDAPRTGFARDEPALRVEHESIGIPRRPHAPKDPCAAIRAETIDMFAVSEIEGAVLPRGPFPGADQPVVLGLRTLGDGRLHEGTRCEGEGGNGKEQEAGFHAGVVRRKNRRRVQPMWAWKGRGADSARTPLRVGWNRRSAFGVRLRGTSYRFGVSPWGVR